MRKMSIIKMHGAGNDYVFLDGFAQSLPQNLTQVAIDASNRHFGIGADGLITLEPPRDEASDVIMRMWNADGSTGAMCGNGVRCVALWMHLQDRVQETCRIQTETRTVNVKMLSIDRMAQSGVFTVDMGPPQFDPNATISLLPRVSLQQAEDSEAGSFECTSVSMGNQHAVIHGHALTDYNVRKIGAEIQQHVLYPDSTNVEWVQVNSSTDLTVRVLERGAGETLACGSGACAAVVASVLRGVCAKDTDIEVRLPGGQLTVRWQESGNVRLTGPAEVSFTADWAA